MSEKIKIEQSIPPITDPMGRYWEQPPVADIVIDDTHAMMTQETFDALLDYSASNPTGAYEGKMWKRHDGALDARFLASGNKPVWMLCWFGMSKIGPGYVSNNNREILVVD